MVEYLASGTDSTAHENGAMVAGPNSAGQADLSKAVAKGQEACSEVNDVYRNPRYYEIAFSFRDISAEVDVMQELIRRHSRIPVSVVLELGCGPAPHLAELAGRGYEYVGLDLSPEMLAHAGEKASSIDAPARFRLADMVDFELDEQVDFAFVLLGSLQARCTAGLVSHFDCVARSLKPGGLYLLDSCVIFSPSPEIVESWEMESGDVRVKTTYRAVLRDPVEQIAEEAITLVVEDGGQRQVLREMGLQRQIYPQEFLMLVANRGDFELAGWWNNWDLSQPLDGTQEIDRPIAVLRRL